MKFKPDWSRVWTIEEAERELSGFKFTGPGWYLGEEDAMLVLAVDRTPATLWYPGCLDREERFEFNVYSDSDICEVFRRIVTAPVRRIV